jgi:exodeoxyribonuclease-3
VRACGDFNVAHQEIDIARPKENRFSAGFSDEERASFSALLDSGFIDTFRLFDQRPHQYSWWSYRAGARGKNVGWRIDYWLASEALKPRLKAARIRQEIHGSDHCPVELEID